MHFFRLIGRAVKALRRALRILPKPAAPVAERSRPIGDPAVAGFVNCAHVDRFFLASRLASIAKLNVPLGRKPRLENKDAVEFPAVPVARLGGKKRRHRGNPERRVLSPGVTAAVAHDNVVPFPSKAVASAESSAVHAKAA